MKHHSGKAPLFSYILYLSSALSPEIQFEPPMHVMTILKVISAELLSGVKTTIRNCWANWSRKLHLSPKIVDVPRELKMMSIKMLGWQWRYYRIYSFCSFAVERFFFHLVDLGCYTSLHHMVMQPTILLVPETATYDTQPGLTSTWPATWILNPFPGTPRWYQKLN